MKFLELQQKLQELKLNVFTLNDILKITGQTKEITKSKLTILIKQKKIIRLKKGYYSLLKIENKFQLQKIYKETYIALQSALEYYESTTQRFKNLDLITKNILSKQNVNETTINFHKVKKNMFFGYKKIIVNNTEIFISNIEKTIIDCIYFSSKVYLTESLQFIKKYKEEIDLDLLTNYLEKISSSILNKRIGYLLELQGIKLKDLNINNKYEKLNINKTTKGNKNRKWKLIINEEL
jgi:predicted transcriptional regulator of viral defense system